MEMMGDESMLETAQERIKLLKAGITGNQIEELYILYNNFKVVGNQRPIEKFVKTKSTIKLIDASYESNIINQCAEIET